MRQTVRAIIKNQANNFYLVEHHYKKPENMGKWSTLGGGVDETDTTLVDALKRELKEELGNEDSHKIQIIRELETLNSNGLHTFFYCESESLDFSEIDQSEIKSIKAFSIDKLKELNNANKLFFGHEYNLIIKYSL